MDYARVSNVHTIANAIIESIDLNREMHVMDFGSGTGLLLESIAHLVGKITAVDVSQAMNEQLAKKKTDLPCALDILELDLVSANIPDKFDGIVSSMTMHHIADTTAMFAKFYDLINEGGFIAISDLDSEDGSFHTEDTGVYHFGFDRDVIAEAANAAGFRDTSVSDASVVTKPHGEYPVFLLTARK